MMSPVYELNVPEATSFCTLKTEKSTLTGLKLTESGVVREMGFTRGGGFDKIGIGGNVKALECSTAGLSIISRYQNSNIP